MKTASFAATAVLVMFVTPVFASTPSADPFGASANDQMQPAPRQDADRDTDAFVSPFGDHLQQNRQDDLRPMNGRDRNDLQPPRMDASGVPDPLV